MAARGHEVSIITTDRSEILPMAESRPGLEIIRVKAYPSDRDYYVAPAIRRYLLHEQPDVVHVQSYHTAVAPLALHWLTRSKTPFVLSFHSGGSSSRWRRQLRPLQHRVLKHYASRAERLLAVSEFERELFLDSLGVHPDQIRVIRNGVSDAIVGQRGSVDRDHSLIVSAGRLERYKGHHRVIEAMPAVRRAIPTARLLVVGSGPYGPELRRMADELDVGDAVTFTSVPQLDRAAMGRLLAQATVSAHLSDYEAEGIGVIEARAMGCRVVVMANTALLELIKKHQAISVPDQPSCTAVARALIDALEAGPADLNAPVRTWQDVTDDLEKTYRAILAPT